MSINVFDPSCDILYDYFQHTTQPIVIFDQDGQLIHSNIAFTDFSGVVQSEKLHALNLFTDFQLTPSQCEKIVTTNELKINLSIHPGAFIEDNNHKINSTELVTVVYTIRMIKRQFIHLSMDINRELQQTNENHFDESKQLLTLFNNMSTGFAIHKIITDEESTPVDYEILYVNPAYETLIGLKRNAIIGKTMRNIMPDIEMEWIDKFGQIALNGGATNFTQYMVSLKRYFDVIAYQTEPNHFAVLFTDVTDNIRAEKILIRADKINSIGQLAGGIAHDFNNHLQIIRGYTEIMEERIKAGTSDDILQYLERVQLSVKHSSNMIKQLLVFSTEENFKIKPLDFHLLLHQTKSILAYTINRNIPIQLLLDAESHIIQGDETLLQNAIINMCLNSRDALPNGGLILIMTRNITFDRPTKIGEEKLEPGTYIRCSIRDNGDGIPAEDLSRIFEPFYTTKLNKGTGMGLPAVYRTVVNHHGAISVSSQYGEWTQFDIYLKTTVNPVVYESFKREPQISTFTPYNILLVDDEPVIAQVISEYLQDLGHCVTVYTNPNELLSEYSNFINGFDVALLDVIMPEMNGFELLEELIKLTPDIRAIFLSGYYNDGDIKSSIRPYILDYIEKPVNLSRLNDKIQRLLSAD